MIVVTVLIYVLSLILQLPSRVNIYNQCSNTRLASSVYFGNDTVSLNLSGEQIGFDTKMKTHSGSNVTQDDFVGALLFKLQRCSNWYNMSISTTETSENESTHVYMLAAWKVKNSTPFVRVALVEHAKEFTWDKYELQKLYDKNYGWLKKCDDVTSYTWFMGDNMALKTLFRARVLEGKFELGIVISEEKDGYAVRPLCINLER
jgi:hypothetical protein